MFSALRQSGTVYILTKGDTPALKTGVVQSVSSPVTKFGTQLMPGQYQQDTVIDLAVKVENMIRTSKEVLGSVEYHKKALEACESIMCSLNPRLAEEREQREKIETLERKLGGIEDTVGDMRELLLKALNKVSK